MKKKTTIIILSLIGIFAATFYALNTRWYLHKHFPIHKNEMVVIELCRGQLIVCHVNELLPRKLESRFYIKKSKEGKVFFPWLATIKKNGSNHFGIGLMNHTSAYRKEKGIAFPLWPLFAAVFLLTGVIYKKRSKSGKGECLAPPPHTTGHAGPHPAVRKASPD